MTPANAKLVEDARSRADSLRNLLMDGDADCLDQLADALEAAAKDAERLDWLVKNAYTCDNDERWWVQKMIPYHESGDIRQAIDAARNQP